MYGHALHQQQQHTRDWHGEKEDDVVLYRERPALPGVGGINKKLILLVPISTVVLIILVLQLFASQDSVDNLLVKDVSSFPDMVEISRWGQRGQAVKVNTSRLGRLHWAEYEDGFRHHGYNQFLSDRISARRTLRDVRHLDCSRLKYVTSELPATSVVIVFKDEARSVLLRTIYGVLDRSPPDVLHEVILVDSGSTRRELQSPDLDNHLAHLHKVKVHHLGEGQSLTSGYLEGARFAESEVIVFLSSHSEVTVGWLEPLLQRLHHKTKASNLVVAPVVDEIHYDTLEYKSNPYNISRYTWNWELQICPEIVEAASNTFPQPTATLGHMTFAVRRNFLQALGNADSEWISGTDSLLAFSFRVWLCSGRMEVVPCSRIGVLSHHPLFYERLHRDDGNFPLSMADRVYLAEGWMRGWQEFVYERLQSGAQVELPDVTHLHTLQSNLKCQKFSWYLQDVRPDLWLGEEPIVYRGLLRSLVWNVTVLQLGLDEHKNVTFEDWYITRQTYWYLTSSGRLKTAENVCLGVLGDSLSLSAISCKAAEMFPGRPVNLEWSLLKDEFHFMLVHQRSGLCLTWHLYSSLRLKHTHDLANRTVPHMKWSALLTKCQAKKPSQRWIFSQNINFRNGSNSSSQHDMENILKHFNGSNSNNFIQKKSINPG